MNFNSSDPHATTWANTFATLFGAIITILAAVIGALTAMGILSNISQHVWMIIALLELPVIAFLTISLSRRAAIRLATPSGVSHPDTFRMFVRNYLHDYQQQLEQLKTGSISLYGISVRRGQLKLFEAARNYSDNKEILAVDITANIDIWTTRNMYFKANEAFINQLGGRIRRIFLVSRELICESKYALQLFHEFRRHKSIGVDVGLHIIESLRQDYVEDFVVFYGVCVMLEVDQADVEFQRGRTDFDFRDARIKLYIDKFNYIWNQNDTQSAKEVAANFEAVVGQSNQPVDVLSERLLQFATRVW